MASYVKKGMVATPHSLFAIVGVGLFKGKFHSCRTSLDWNAEP